MKYEKKYKRACQNLEKPISYKKSPGIVSQIRKGQPKQMILISIGTALHINSTLIA